MVRARSLVITLAVPAMLLAGLGSARADRPPFVFPPICCYYNGEVVRTVTPPAAAPKEGVDNFYAFPSGGSADQLGIAGVAPGAAHYHGGHWAFYAVTFMSRVTPYTLTSEEAVLAAQAAGDVMVTRVPENDFKCPIQP